MAAIRTEPLSLGQLQRDFRIIGRVADGNLASDHVLAAPREDLSGDDRIPRV
jgi:hypothetical protein